MLSAKMSGEFKHRGNPPHQFMRLGRLRKRIDLSNTNGDVRILAQASRLLCCHLQSILTLTLTPGGGLLPYITYTGMCRPTGSGF